MAREPQTRSRTSELGSLETMDGTVDLVRDRELVEACQAGDESAFAELYSRYHRRLLRFCLRRLHTTDDAEEAVQEAFTRAWRALPRFGGDRRFYPWLSVIAGNVCTDMLRRRSRLVPLDEIASRGADGAAEAEVDERLLRQVDLAMASEALGHLSDRHQRVLRLREATEWTSQRIAEHEGVAVPAVDTLLWRARQAFKREFAALSDAGGLAAVLGLGVAALRRGLGRAGARMATLATAPTRSPGALVATVAITGAAVAGGGVAILGATHHPAAASAAAPVVAAPPSGTTAGPALPGPTTVARDLHAAASSATGTTGTSGATGPATNGAGTAGPSVTGADPGTAGHNALGAGLPSSRGSSTAGSGPQQTIGGLASNGTAAVGALGQAIGSGLADAGQALGLLTTPPAMGSGTATSSGSAGTPVPPLTPGTAVGGVATAVSGATTTVTTTASTLAEDLLGTAK